LAILDVVLLAIAAQRRVVSVVKARQSAQYSVGKGRKGYRRHEYCVSGEGGFLRYCFIG
jgi:hypothetical protein